jgi:hypothetical protein
MIMYANQETRRNTSNDELLENLFRISMAQTKDGKCLS